MRVSSMRTRLWAFATATIVVAAGLVATVAPSPAEALSGAEFDPGYIISDAAFYDANAMSQPEIQAFLELLVPGSCGPESCLKNYRMTTPDREQYVSRFSGKVECQFYQGAANELASTIIFRVQQACEISAKVLLVTMQKERGLVTKSSPTASDFKVAMGYGCPDSALCDTNYYGLFNQLRSAAEQFKVYRNNPGYFGYQAGRVNNIQYKPFTSCGTLAVNIRNQATAGLYNYTPYVPNAAALANLSGIGDGCSSYGNRNFWVFYNNWFGSPTGPRSPIGAMQADPVVGGINFWGWAIDPDTAAPITVHLYIDSASYGVIANTDRPDVGALYPDKGSAHGFNKTIPASSGSHQACVYGINVDGGVNTLLGCMIVFVPGGDPIGELTAVTASPGKIAVSGWAIDPDTVNPGVVHVYVDGASFGYLADKPVPSLASSYPAYGTNHGFSVSVPATEGPHRVCVYGINTGLGANSLLSCQQVTVPTTSPFGQLEQAVGIPGSVTFKGWAIDASTVDPITVHVYVDSSSYAVVANGARADIGTEFPDSGPNHGFTTSVPATPGPHKACVYGINVGQGSNTLLGCTTVVVPGGSPIGAISKVTPDYGTLTVEGWALDPDVTYSTSVHVYVDNLSYGFLADQEVPALAVSHPGQGTAHGFSATVNASPGTHNVCVYGINVGSGSNALLGCHTATVPLPSPIGALDQAVGVEGGITFTGWAIDPSTPDPITVHLYVDSASVGVLANVSRSDVGATYPAFGPNHGFENTIASTEGSHRVCAYGINVGVGENSLLGCKTVVVPPARPIGELTSATPGAGVVNVTGWALDPDVLDPIFVHVYVDSFSYGFLANEERPSLATTHPGKGTAHGFTVSVPATSGTHDICVYGINAGVGGNSLFSCTTVTVVP